MQTFMTDADPKVIAQHLDTRRLNKQITEGLQIINSNLDAYYGWRNHPAVLMWRNHEHALATYIHWMIREWWARGYTSHQKSNVQNDWYLISLDDTGWPYWWGDPVIIRSHQSNLVRKDYEYYSYLFPGVPDNLAYCWPIHK